MGTTSGLAPHRGRSQGSEHLTCLAGDHLFRRFSAGIFALIGLLLACGTIHPVASPSVQLSPDQQALMVTLADPAIPSQITLKNLPSESTIAPGLYFRPKRFGLVQVSPDGRFAAFSTVDHHTLVGLLDLTTIAVQEIGVVTEGEVLNFHWTADSRVFLYDYLPASGYQRVRGYDLQSREGLVLPPAEHHSATHLAFERWGSQPREVILSTKDGHTEGPQTTTVRLISSKQLVPPSRPRQ
jgi:hypothetical protein